MTLPGYAAGPCLAIVQRPPYLRHCGFVHSGSTVQHARQGAGIPVGDCTGEPVYEELIRQAAQGQVLHNDDTTVKILEFMSKTRLGEGKRAGKGVLADFGERPGTAGGHAVADIAPRLL